jgi:uncharacterized membrane protein YeaQ/YmgE (transglycosylase-associated protein family)
MGILSWLIVGAIAGWIASFFVKVPIGGLLGNIIAGIIGALVVGWLSATFLGNADPVNGINLGSIIAAAVGAIIVSVVAGMLFGGQRRA